MKSTLLAALVAAGFASAGPASAALVTLDFEGPGSFESIGSYYAGQGVTFGLDALAIRNDELGPYFSNAPSPIGVMTPVGSQSAMNVAPGFNGIASLWYSSTEVQSVSIWSGLDGTGSLLHTWFLDNNAQAGCGDSPYCNWTQLSFDLGASIGRSIVFGGTGAGFDDVAVNTVPVPAALPLLAMGVAGMGAFMRRRRQAAG